MVKVESGLRVADKAWLQRMIASPVVLGLIVFVLALGPRWLDMAVFVGPDEFSWVERSANFTQALASGTLAETYQTGHPGVTLMWVETVGAWLKYGAQWLAGSPDWAASVGSDKSMNTLAGKRQAVGLANALLLVGSVLLIRQLFGNGVAWTAGFLLAFDPFLLTESRALRTEGLLTSFTTLALLSLLLYLKERRLRYSVLTGILTGLALLSKVSAVILLPVAVLAVGGISLFNPARSKAEPWRTAGTALLGWGIAVLATIVLLWPALWVAPVSVTQQLYDYVTVRAIEGEGGGKSFFLGEPYPNEDPGPLFYPVVLLYRTGPLLWLGLILLGAAFWLKRRKPRLEISSLAVAVLLLYLLLYLILITRSDLKYDRYIIPMLPVLNVMAALGLVTTWQELARERNWPGQAGWLLGLLALAVQVGLAWPHHPYYYTYWNPLLGGLKQAANVLPIGVGEGLEQVAIYLNAQPNAEAIKLASANSQKIEPVFKGQTIALENVDGRWVQGDYVLIYISQLQRGKHDQNIVDYLRRQTPVFTVTLHGLDHAWLYPGPAAQYYGGGHKLEGRGSLFGYDLGRTEVAAGEQLPVTLYWRNEGQLESDRFFVRLMDLDGYVWSEALAQPRPGFETANRQRESIVESEAVLALPVGMPPGDYFLKPGFRTDQGEIIGYFELPGETKPIRVDTASTYPAAETFHAPVPADFPVNHDLALLGYQLEPAVTKPGAETWVTLYWQARQPVEHDYVILLRLLDEGEAELAYWLGRPVRSGYPTTAWQAGQIVQDPWLLQAPPEAKPGAYGLEIAVFDAESQQEVNRQMLGQLTIGE